MKTQNVLEFNDNIHGMGEGKTLKYPLNNVNITIILNS
jgi:hypothetical protein